jgi:chromosome segregation ATPase
MGTSVNFATHRMVTFTSRQQKEHRQTFIDDCRQKAWGAACHADWIGKQLDTLVEDYGKLKAEDEKLDAEIKTLETAVDAHTKENRDKRKALQERRNTIAKSVSLLGKNMQDGQQALSGFYQNIVTNLALAKHAETWGWKEVKADPAQP